MAELLAQRERDTKEGTQKYFVYLFSVKINSKEIIKEDSK